MKWKYLMIVLSLTFIVVAGCSKDEVKPVAIDEKTDKCEVCNMAVMDNQFATEIILESGKALKFDDIGCMYQWLKENNDGKIQVMFVRDYHTKEWIELDKATYVYDQSIRTPMAYNIISFKDKEDAKSFISKNNKGTILTYQDLEDHNWERIKEMMEMNKDLNHQMDNNHSH